MSLSLDTPAGGRNSRPPGQIPPELAACPEYEVLRELGRGGMGVVYLARNRLMSRLEALKVMAGPQPKVGLFLREIHAAGRLAHPNVAAAHAAFKVGGGLVLAMEYVDGADLRRHVETRGPMSVPLACECVRQAALGLQHALDRGIVHRDVKPGNLIFTTTPAGVVVKILDFGLAGMIGHGDEDAPLGTPAFAAPEQMADPTLADTRSDVYALGGTLFFLLTGEHPFKAPSSTEVLRRHREEPPRRLDEALPGVPPGLAAAAARMMAKNPADRFQSPAEVAAALAPFADPLAAPARAAAGLTVDLAGDAPTTVSNARRPDPRFRLRVAGVTALILAGVLAVGLVGRWSADRPRPDVAVAPAVPDPDPVPLFDGRTLNGWVVDGGDAGEWRVEDGAVVTTGVPNGPRTWLLTEKEYADFRLRFEYKLEAGGNSGVAFRAVPGERPVVKPPSGLSMTPYHQQIELSDDAHQKWAKMPTGQVNGALTSDGPALKPRKPSRPPAAGEWHRMEVEFRGQAVRVTLNGEPILTADLTTLAAAGSPYPAVYRARGRVGFQQFAKTAAFRNVTVQELPPAR